MPLLSIIIVTYTAKRLTDVIGLLESIQAQNFRDFEVLLVCEKGEVYELMRSQVASRFSDVRVLESSGMRSSGSARNVGIQSSTGRLVAFVDDDAILARDWARELVNAFDNDANIAGVTGFVLPEWERKPPYWILPEFSWILGYSAWHGWHSARDVESVWLMNCGFERNALKSAGGFRPQFGARGDITSYWSAVGAEENELSLRVHKSTGMRIVYTPRVIAWHRVKTERLRLSYLLRRAFHIGKNRAWLRKHYLFDSKFGLDATIEDRVLVNSIKGVFAKLRKDGNPFHWLGVLSYSSLVLGSTLLGYLSIPSAMPSLFYHARPLY